MMDKPELGPFHHVGVAVQDIQASAEQFKALFGAVIESDVLHDANQQVRVQFVRLGGLRVELVEPAAEGSPVDSILRRGIALYHVCHEVDDLDAELSRLRSRGVIMVSPPKPAAAFGHRRVAFIICQGLMIELLEAEKR